jgi:hypothetical protein
MTTAYTTQINRILVTASNLDDAKASCRANDQRNELAPGSETWGIIHEGGQRGQMTRYANGRGAVCFGGDSSWGDWVGGMLALDSGDRVSEYGEIEAE